MRLVIRMTVLMKEISKYMYIVCLGTIKTVIVQHVAT